MALEATHIRFALDIRDQYQVKDLKSYVVGAIYPDSCYFTGIDRALTYGADIVNKKFAKNDFRKGWQTHQLCDDIQNKIRIEFLPELLVPHKKAWCDEEWVNATAFKILQDQYDFQQYDLEAYLPLLDFAHNPNGEELTAVLEYNQIMANMYRGKRKTKLEDYLQLMFTLDTSLGLVENIREKVIEIQSNEELLQRIYKVYDMILENYRQTV